MSEPVSVEHRLLPRESPQAHRAMDNERTAALWLRAAMQAAQEGAPAAARKLWGQAGITADRALLYAKLAQDPEGEA